MKQRKQDELNEIITSENLKADETDKFMANAFRDGAIRTTGTDIDKILPAMSSFGGGNRRKPIPPLVFKYRLWRAIDTFLHLRSGCKKASTYGKMNFAVGCGGQCSGHDINIKVLTLL